VPARGRAETVERKEFRLHARHLLILHGRYTCKARKPERPRCVVNGFCKFKDETLAL
jgi:endonuclease III